MQRGGLALFTDNLVLFCRFEHNFALSARRRNRAYQAARASWSRVSQPVESALIKRLLIAKPSIKSADEPTREISVSCGNFRESCVLIRIEIFVMESSDPWIGSFSFFRYFSTYNHSQTSMWTRMLYMRPKLYWITYFVLLRLRNGIVSYTIFWYNISNMVSHDISIFSKISEGSFAVIHENIILATARPKK